MKPVLITGSAPRTRVIEAQLRSGFDRRSNTFTPKAYSLVPTFLSMHGDSFFHKMNVTQRQLKILRATPITANKLVVERLAAELGISPRTILRQRAEALKKIMDALWKRKNGPKL
jgi:predicted DNA-binding protein (UPF0251 family)